MFWNEQTSQMYIDAAQYSNFHQTLADCLTPYLKADDVLLDIGCGHGFLSAALLPYIKRRVCLDEDPAVLNYIARTNPNQTDLIQADATSGILPACDVALVSFFGHIDGIYAAVKQSARIIITVKNVARTVYEFKHQQPLRRETHGDVIAFCSGQNLAYSAKQLTLNFGQPFRSKDDIITFLARYKPLSQGDYQHYINQRVQAINHPNFTYYLPKSKQIGIVIIHPHKENTQ